MTRIRWWRCAKSPKTTVSPGDLKEDLVHSLQKYVEVDEPEPETVPLIGGAGGSVDADDTEVVLERMTEEELLKGLEGSRRPRSSPKRRSRQPSATDEPTTARGLPGPFAFLQPIPCFSLATLPHGHDILRAAPGPPNTVMERPMAACTQRRRVSSRIRRCRCRRPISTLEHGHEY